MRGSHAERQVGTIAGFQVFVADTSSPRAKCRANSRLTVLIKCPAIPAMRKGFWMG